MSWGHGAVQRALLAELQKQQQAIDTVSLLRIICDGDDPTHSQGQSARRALRMLTREGVVIAHRSAGILFWQIIPKLADPDSSCVNSSGTSIAKKYSGPMRYGHSAQAPTLAKMSQALRSLVSFIAAPWPRSLSRKLK